jgi:acyl carrier protein
MTDLTARLMRDIVDEVLTGNELNPGAPVDLDDDLYELGFDSLIIIQVAARVRERLGVDPPLGAYFDAGTVGELVTLVRDAPPATGEASGPPVAPIAEGAP